MPALVTERLRLVPITLEAIEAVLDQDQPRAEALTGATFPPAWPNHQLLEVGFPFSRVLRDEPRVVGSVVFHGRPRDGIAEVGYSIEPQSRGNGLATEATRACVAWAFEQAGITAVQATTFPWNVASLAVIRHIGMQHVATREHDTLGELLVFERRR